MVLESSTVKLVLEEGVRKSSEGFDASCFSEELRRLEKYDSEVCPLRWRPVLEDIKDHGTMFGRDRAYKIGLLRRFAERSFIPEEHSDRLTDIKRLGPVEIKHLREEGETSVRTRGPGSWTENPGISFRLEDEVPGFSMVFGRVRHQDLLSGPPYVNRNMPFANIYGLPEKAIKVGTKSQAFKLGTLSLEELDSVALRRFMYTFGMNPAENRDVVRTLVKINEFPRISSDGNPIHYRLEERSISELNPTRGAVLVYDEAIDAKEKGLFAEVKSYGLCAKEVPVSDPVIVGFDHFGNMVPLIYWSGDTGLS